MVSEAEKIISAELRLSPCKLRVGQVSRVIDWVLPSELYMTVTRHTALRQSYNHRTHAPLKRGLVRA